MHLADVCAFRELLHLACFVGRRRVESADREECPRHLSKEPPSISPLFSRQRSFAVPRGAYECVCVCVRRRNRFHINHFGHFGHYLRGYVRLWRPAPGLASARGSLQPDYSPQCFRSFKLALKKAECVTFKCMQPPRAAGEGQRGSMHTETALPPL